MGSVVALPLKCPLCEGTGKVETYTGVRPGPDGFNILVANGSFIDVQCCFCRGTGKRPSEAELQRRREATT